jgi:hemerythrin superfamily protein
MNAIDFLIKEHNKVRKMLTDINDKSHLYETQKKRFSLLSQDLIRHETMEHEVWYPYLKGKLPGTVKHLVTEEKHADKVIKKLDALKTKEAWEINFLKFKKEVEHHASEEETVLFPEVQKILSEKQLEDIGMKMFHFKKEFPRALRGVYYLCIVLGLFIPGFTAGLIAGFILGLIPGFTAGLTPGFSAGLMPGLTG